MGRFLHAFFSPLGLRRAVPQVWDGFQTNLKLMVVAEVLVLVFALVIAIIRGLPGRGTLPAPRARDRLHRLLSRHAADPRRVRRSALGLPSLQIAVISDQSLFVYGVLSLTLVYTAYVTEVYRAGHRVGPSEPAHGGALARADLRPDDAIRRSCRRRSGASSRRS